MSQENLVEFEDYVAAIGRRRRMIAAVVLAFVILGAVLSILSTKQYTSESRVNVTPAFQPGGTSAEEVNTDTERGIAQSQAVASIAGRLMNSDAAASDLLSHVGVDPIGESSILAIRYTDTNPGRAYRGADAFARAYLQFRSEQADEATRQARERIDQERADNRAEIGDLEAQLEALTAGTPEFAEISSRLQALDGTQSSLDRELEDLTSETASPGTIIDEAEVPTSPSSPGLVLNVAGAALIGLIIALSATFVLERKNLGNRARPDEQDEPAPPPAVVAVPATPAVVATAPTPTPVPALAAPALPVAATQPVPQPEPSDRRHRRDSSQVLAGLGVELLGNVPRLSNDAGEPAFDAVALGGPAGEALRRLHTELRFRLAKSGANVVFVTSAIERGVTVGLAGGLAATAALTGQDALLIAGDLHHPKLHDRLELGNDQGLAEVLNGTRPMTHVLQGWSGIENLCVVTAGRPGPDPSSLVTADRLATQLATIRGEFQLIVIEGPPIGETLDATVMAAVSDAVILAVDPRHSGEQALGGAVTTLRHAGAPLLGAVVVEARAPRTGLPQVAAAASPNRR